MNKKALYILIFLICQMVSHTAVAAIGDWKVYMAYSDVQEIEQAGNLIFVQASNDLYVYNQNDQSIQTFSKIDYLNDCEIQHIAYNKASQRLFIIYTNGNIDLMNVSNYEVTNLSDYQNAITTGDKTVNDIYMNGKYAYLSNGFGIVKVNVADSEISDTYNLGFAVNWCEIDGNTIYAYSVSNGKYSASLTDNLLDKSSWNRVGGYVAKQQEDKSELKQLVSKLNPGGPKYNYFGFMKFGNGQLYSCGGGFTTGVIRNGCIQLLKNDDWNIYSDDNITANTHVTYQNIECLDYDPTDINHVFAGGRNGLYEYQDGKFINYHNYQNSPIEIFNQESIEYQIILSNIFDAQGNLWMLNSQAPTKSLLEYTKDKRWISHHIPELMKLDDGNFKNKSLGSLKGMMIDSRGLLWFVNDHWANPSFYCYQFSENENEEKINSYTSFVNQDGTKIEATFVRCITEDKEKNMWIGTNVGPIVLTPDQITAATPEFTQIKVPRNDGTNYADYLLSGVDISCICIDANNRKWFGTKGNGVYLINSDNITELHHFTQENSPLLSDGIESIAINNETGEIYFGTDKGLCSYTSYSSSNGSNDNNIWAYPNPVKPNYTGNITITGLENNTNVKILTSNGVLVNEGISTGNIYSWDGCDLQGKRVASGVYMVHTATENGDKGSVCKIAIIH